MKEFITELFKGKHVAIFGFGKEGRSSYRFLRSCLPGHPIFILDSNTHLQDDPEIANDPGLELITGEDFSAVITEFDYILKAPGVPGSAFPERMDHKRITSQTDLFLRYYRKQVIGVTGTKGKSTTASLISHILTRSGYHTILLGNIGLPPFEGIPEITPETRIVMELSSHQLEYLTRSPHIAVLLNIFQEHLDHYTSYVEYQHAKMNIGRYQDMDDYFIYSADNKLLSELVQRETGFGQNLFPYTLNTPGENRIYRIGNSIRIIDQLTEYELVTPAVVNHLPGEHNFSNIMAAAAACHFTGASPAQIGDAVGSFKGLEHRIEYVGEFEGVRYYNDSIATIPEAAIEAVKTLKEVDTLILGGFDRGIDYSILYPFLEGSGISNVIFVGEAGKRMRRELGNSTKHGMKLFNADNFREVVMIARQETKRGRICLLSPAASSYDMFMNFEHRGNIFKKNVREISPSHE